VPTTEWLIDHYGVPGIISGILIVFIGLLLRHIAQQHQELKEMTAKHAAAAQAFLDASNRYDKSMEVMGRAVDGNTNLIRDMNAAISTLARERRH